MQALKRQEGYSLVEILVTVVIFTIVASITVATLTGQRRNSDNQAARQSLISAHEGLQEYFNGQISALSTSFDGLTAAKANQIIRGYSFQDATAPDLVPANSANPKTIVIRQAGGPAANDDLTLILCNASKRFVYCLTDTGQGPSFGASTATENEAATRSTASNNTCTGSIGKAERYAERSGSVTC